MEMWMGVRMEVEKKQRGDGMEVRREVGVESGWEY